MVEPSDVMTFYSRLASARSVRVVRGSTYDATSRERNEDVRAERSPEALRRLGTALRVDGLAERYDWMRLEVEFASAGRPTTLTVRNAHTFTASKAEDH